MEMADSLTDDLSVLDEVIESDTFLPDTHIEYLDDDDDDDDPEDIEAALFALSQEEMDEVSPGSSYAEDIPSEDVPSPEFFRETVDESVLPMSESSLEESSEFDELVSAVDEVFDEDNGLTEDKDDIFADAADGDALINELFGGDFDSENELFSGGDDAFSSIEDSSVEFAETVDEASDLMAAEHELEESLLNDFVQGQTESGDPSEEAVLEALETHPPDNDLEESLDGPVDDDFDESSMDAMEEALRQMAIEELGSHESESFDSSDELPEDLALENIESALKELAIQEKGESEESHMDSGMEERSSSDQAVPTPSYSDDTDDDFDSPEAIEAALLRLAGQEYGFGEDDSSSDNEDRPVESSVPSFDIEEITGASNAVDIHFKVDGEEDEDDFDEDSPEAIEAALLKLAQEEAFDEGVPTSASSEDGIDAELENLMAELDQVPEEASAESDLVENLTSELAVDEDDSDPLDFIPSMDTVEIHQGDTHFEDESIAFADTVEIPVDALNPHEIEPEAVPEIFGDEIEPEAVPEIFGDETEPEAVPEIFGDETEPEAVPEIFGDETEPEAVPEIFGDETEPEAVPEIFGDEIDPEAVPEIFGDEIDPEVVPEIFGDETEPEAVPEIFGDETEPEAVPEIFGDETAPEVVPEIFGDEIGPEAVPEIFGDETAPEAESVDGSFHSTDTYDDFGLELGDLVGTGTSIDSDDFVEEGAVSRVILPEDDNDLGMALDALASFSDDFGDETPSDQPIEPSVPEASSIEPLESHDLSQLDDILLSADDVEAPLFMDSFDETSEGSLPSSSGEDQDALEVSSVSSSVATSASSMPSSVDSLSLDLSSLVDGPGGDSSSPSGDEEEGAVSRIILSGDGDDDALSAALDALASPDEFSMDASGEQPQGAAGSEDPLGNALNAMSDDVVVGAPPADMSIPTTFEPEHLGTSSPGAFDFLTEGEPAERFFEDEGQLPSDENEAQLAFAPDGEPAQFAFAPDGEPAQFAFAPDGEPAQFAFAPDGEPAQLAFAPDGVEEDSFLADALADAEEVLSQNSEEIIQDPLNQEQVEVADTLSESVFPTLFEPGEDGAFVDSAPFSPDSVQPEIVEASSFDDVLKEAESVVGVAVAGQNTFEPSSAPEYLFGGGTEETSPLPVEENTPEPAITTPPPVEHPPVLEPVVPVGPRILPVGMDLSPLVERVVVGGGDDFSRIYKTVELIVNDTSENNEVLESELEDLVASYPDDRKLAFALGTLQLLCHRKIQGAAHLYSSAQNCSAQGDLDNELYALELLYSGNENDSGVAAELAQRLVEADQTFRAVFVLKESAELAVKEGLFDNGVRLLEMAAKIDPFDESVLVLLMDTYRQGGKDLKALDFLNSRLAQSPADVLYVREKSTSLYRLGRITDAEQAFTDALSLSSGDLSSLIALEQYYSYSEIYSFRDLVRQKIIELDPENNDIQSKIAKEARLASLKTDLPLLEDLLPYDEADVVDGSSAFAPGFLDDEDYVPETIFTRAISVSPRFTAAIEELEALEDEMKVMEDGEKVADKYVAGLVRKFLEVGTQISEKDPANAMALYDRSRTYLNYFDDPAATFLWSEQLEKKIASLRDSI